MEGWEWDVDRDTKCAGERKEARSAVNNTNTVYGADIIISTKSQTIRQQINTTN